MYKAVFYFLIIFIGVNSKTNCDSDSLACEEKELVNYVNELEKNQNFGDYIFLEKTTNRTERKIDREENFIERSLRFLEEHELKIKLPSSVETRNIAEGNLIEL